MILAPEAELLTTADAHLLEKILPTKEIKICRQEFEVVPGFWDSDLVCVEDRMFNGKAQGNKFML